MRETGNKKRAATRLAWSLALAVAAVLLMIVILNGSLSPNVAPSNPPPPEGAVIWSANTETGDVSQWAEGQFGESVFNTGTGTVTVTQDVAHSGRYSLKLSITGARDVTQAARILHWNDTPVEGYYSVWLDFPEEYRPYQWWNVVQFKSVGADNVPTWVLNVGNRDDGSMFFYLWDALTGKSYAPLNKVTIPVSKWTQVKAYVRRASDRTGRITIWEDGVLLFDIDQVQTAVGDNLHFGVGNYTDHIIPADTVIYADDAEIRGVKSINPAETSTGPNP